MRIGLTVACAVVALALLGCNGSGAAETGRETKAEISKSRGFGSYHDKPFLTLEGEDADRVARAIRSAKKQPGIVNIVQPTYDVRLTGAGGKTEAYHLWLSAQDEGATIMNVEETHVIYRVSKEGASDVMELIGEQGTEKHVSAAP
ncbi:MAG TPA: hypothetical protein VEZ72_20325 [Paenibacillus sp.]|nr:hypothetical protein [Paenibacillus sp.]